MNWKFWQKKTPPAAPVIEPPAPTNIPDPAPTEREMNEDETELLRLLRTERWSLRDWKVGETPAIRADLPRLGISIISHETVYANWGGGLFGFPTDPAGSRTKVCSAHFGKLALGVRFANEWHSTVTQKHRDDVAVEQRNAELECQARLHRALFEA